MNLKYLVGLDDLWMELEKFLERSETMYLY